MDEQCPETEPDPMQHAGDPARRLDDTVKGDEQSDRLHELLDQWELQFDLAGETSQLSLDIDDPQLRAVLAERIEERKRLYESLGLATQTGIDGASGEERVPVGLGNSCARFGCRHG